MTDSKDTIPLKQFDISIDKKCKYERKYPHEYPFKYSEEVYQAELAKKVDLYGETGIPSQINKRRNTSYDVKIIKFKGVN